MKVFEITMDNAYIFYAYISDIDLEKDSMSVSQYRLNKIQRLRQDDDKKRSLLSELLLLYGLNKLEIPHTTPLEFNENDHGKPYIKDISNWQFNISHGGDMAVCAISENAVGVDIEDIARESRGISEKYFTDAEKELSEKYGMSYIWTRKEAVAKANGTGIGIGIERIDTSNDTVILDGEEYRVFTNRVGKYYISLACR